MKSMQRYVQVLVFNYASIDNEGSNCEDCCCCNCDNKSIIFTPFGSNKMFLHFLVPSRFACQLEFSPIVYRKCFCYLFTSEDFECARHAS